MRKYQSVEAVKVLSESEQDQITENLHALGKTSARELTDEERRNALNGLTSQK